MTTTHSVLQHNTNMPWNTSSQIVFQKLLTCMVHHQLYKQPLYAQSRHLSQPHTCHSINNHRRATQQWALLRLHKIKQEPTLSTETANQQVIEPVCTRCNEPVVHASMHRPFPCTHGKQPCIKPGKRWTASHAPVWHDCRRNPTHDSDHERQAAPPTCATCHSGMHLPCAAAAS